MSDHSESQGAWQPRTSIETSQHRASMLRKARRFFADRNVLEVDTPALSSRAVTDPNIESLQTGCSQAPLLYLQTSPEHFMKRMLAAGYPDIYQICKVFRDREFGHCHLPEFTMAEWYRLNFSLQEIMQDTVDFVCHLLGRNDLQNNVRYLSYVEAFEIELHLDPINADIRSLTKAAQADETLVESLEDDRDAWLDLVLTRKVASAFPVNGLTVLYHYPASQAALARRCPADNGVADRFELYYGSLELANGFVELTDADEQLARFRSEQARRRDRGQEIHEIDRHLIAALCQGLPPCAGVAVGFDRLLMLHEENDDISSVTTFSFGA